MKTFWTLFPSTMHGGRLKLYEIYVRAPSRFHAAYSIKHRFGHWPKSIRRAINMDSVSDDASKGVTQVINWRTAWPTSMKA